MTKAKKGKNLPEHLETQRTHVTCGPEFNSHVNTLTSANIFRPLGVDNSWDFEEFKQDFELKINRIEDDTMEFEMIGCDPAIANALRRILIAEVPTIAIEHVFMVDNTSIIQDEVLSHRLGLVPLRVRPDLFEYKSAEEAAGEKNTLVFKLDVACKRVNGRIINEKVLSSHMQWLPQGSEMPEETSCRFAQGQAHMFGSDPASQPGPVHPDILLAKLRPGQRILLEAHAVKGIGKEHAKWSPVATAWYKLQPEVVLLKEDVDDEVADLLLETAPGLFVREGKGKKLRVTSAREHVKHLEKLRILLERPEVSEVVAYRKVKEHFIFTLESSGVLPPEELLMQALDILRDKAVALAGRL
mmetsp:Transcript_12794/g.27685  ORF Transcript_12794/g.27685 Transcript_12794/m.27685 type:complete len:357 (+) Transcript_12794:127-1197(+)